LGFKIMDKDIILLDLFSGIGGFSLGLSQARFNITTHYYSEIDKHAIAVYKHQFKNSTYVGSVTDLDGRAITRPNIITFGSPCQDFSVAGKRAGMEGQRSSLIREAIRLITECRPDVFIWENVKGVFSSNSGADFWAIIQAFTNIGSYRLEWQLLNSSWIYPQNRERIYLVGRIGSRCQETVFPFSESDNWDSPQIPRKLIIRGRNKNTSGCLDTRGSNRYGRSDLDKLIYCVAQRGRGENNIQQLEFRKDKNTNSLTGVQKDNLVFVGEINEHNRGDGSHSRDFSMQDRIYDATKSKECTTLNATSNSKYLTKTGIRRLTELEYERLQGFPDEWTKYGIYDDIIKRIPSSQRYKMTRNAVSVYIVTEIGKRLLKNID
jgi:DNA (cytosine-5)-methyltransferase 1